MDCIKNRAIRRSGYFVPDDVFLDPERGNGVGEFVLEDFDEFFVFRLTIGPTLYKYMRMYLWTDVWQQCCVV